MSACTATVSVVGRQDGDRDVRVWSVARPDDRWPDAMRVVRAGRHWRATALRLPHPYAGTVVSAPLDGTAG